MLTLLKGALLGNRVRSLVTAAAVAVAVASYLAVAFYFTVHVPQPHLPPVDLPADMIVTPGTRDLDAFEAGLTSRWPEVRVLERYALAFAYTADGVQEILAMDEDSRFRYGLIQLVEGAFPGPGQVLLPVIEGMDWGVRVGEETRFMFEPSRRPRWVALEVSGFYEPLNRRFACPVIATGTIGDLDPYAPVRYLVYLDDGVDPDLVAASMDRDRGLVQGVETASGIYEQELDHEWRETYRSVYNSARGLVALLMAVAAVGILNTVYLALLYRQREMGILKALGMRPRALFALLALEGLCLGTVGSVLGTAVFLTTLGVMKAMGVTSGSLSPLLLAAGSALGMVVSLAASVIPADAAQHASPLDLLRAPQ